MSEASKTRHRILHYLQGNGIDIGCGDDKVTHFCIGFDRRPEEGVNWQLDLRDGLPLRDQACDYVFSSHTLEDFEDTAAILAEWWRVLKVGGHLILYLPDRRWYPNIGHPLANKAHRHDFIAEDVLTIVRVLDLAAEVVEREDFPPPNGAYDYERRGEIEYSFLLVLRRTG